MFLCVDRFASFAPYESYGHPTYISLDFIEMCALGCAVLEDVRRHGDNGGNRGQEGSGLSLQAQKLLERCPWVDSVFSVQMLLAHTYSVGAGSHSYKLHHALPALRSLNEFAMRRPLASPVEKSTGFTGGEAGMMDGDMQCYLVGTDAVVLLSVSDPTVEPYVLGTCGTCSESSGSLISGGSNSISAFNATSVDDSNIASNGSTQSAQSGSVSSAAAVASNARTLVAANRWTCENVALVRGY